MKYGGRDVECMPLRSRRGGEVTIHMLIWAQWINPTTLCRMFAVRDDPTEEMQLRNQDLVVNCMMCIAEMED